MKTHAFRLRDGQDLREEIDKFSQTKHIKAGCIVSCVGSLKVLEIRLAGAKAGLKKQPFLKVKGPFEIVSFVETPEEGNSHLHISVADKKGKMLGGI